MAYIIFCSGCSKIMLITILVLTMTWKTGFSASLNDTKTLLSHLLADYNVNIRPVQNQDDPIVVYIQPYVKSIQEFDEVKEMFSFVGALGAMWSDVNMVWDPLDYGGVSEVSVSYSEVWVPELVLSSPSDDVETMGKKWNKVRFYSTGLAMWLPVDLIKSTCSVNVEYYPFDSQSCVTSFNALGYNPYELTILPMNSEIDMTIYQENSLWEIKSTSVAVDESQLDCTFNLQRKPSFVVINILLPILFLSLLNVLVFLLVPESGERASYCITVLLSIAVFMTIVSDLLPRSSQPVPIISFKLMVDMVISSLIVLVTIYNLRVYSRDNSDPVPKWLQKIYIFLSCAMCGQQKIQPKRKSLKTYIPKADGDQTDNQEKITSMKNIRVSTVLAVETGIVEKKAKESPIVSLTEEIIKRQKITWKKISFMYDWIALVVFTTLSLASFSLFLAVTAVK